MDKIRKILQGRDGVFLIAEIGKNFIQSADQRPVSEYLAKAKELIKLAKESGADAVKFQTHNLDDEQMNIQVTAPHFSGADRYSWIKRNTEATPPEFWQSLKEYADEVGILFFTTPMSRGAAQMVNELVSLWKVGSGDILDFVLLDYVASTKKPIIISTGMSTLSEVDLAVDFLKRRQAEFILLHCVSKYPCPPEDLSLGTIKFLEKRYGVAVGFSDHSIGSESAVAAVNLEAKVIEKHFSLDRELWGSDHKVSMTPAEFRVMADLISKGEIANIKDYGDSNKVLQDGEAIFRPLFRKSLVYGCKLEKGVVLKIDHIYAMRPQKYISGLPSEDYEKVIGRKLKQSVDKYQPIRLTDFV